MFSLTYRHQGDLLEKVVKHPDFSNTFVTSPKSTAPFKKIINILFSSEIEFRESLIPVTLDLHRLTLLNIENLKPLCELSDDRIPSLLDQLKNAKELTQQNFLSLVEEHSKSPTTPSAGISS